MNQGLLKLCKKLAMSNFITYDSNTDPVKMFTSIVLLLLT
jgi:hypothetical protein